MTALPSSPLTLAVPKGRLLRRLLPRLARAGVDAASLDEADRRLVREVPSACDGIGLRILLLKPDDVPTYVEYGAADIGVVGRDVLLERDADLYVPLDLEMGHCSLVIAGRENASEHAQRVGPLRVATKYPRVASAHFAQRGEAVEMIFVQGSVEIAPLVGLADRIVDIVETGETLRQNGLSVLETICPISAVAVVNRVAMKLRRSAINQFLAALRPDTATNGVLRNE